MSRKKNKAPKKAKKSSASSSSPRPQATRYDTAEVQFSGLSRAALLELASMPFDHPLVLAQDPNVIELAQTLRSLELGLIDRPTNQIFSAEHENNRNIFADLELEPLKNDDTTFNRLAKGSDASDYRYNITKTLPTLIHDFILAADLNPPSHYKDRKDTLPPAVVKRLAQDNPAPLFELPVQERRVLTSTQRSNVDTDYFPLDLPVAHLHNQAVVEADDSLEFDPVRLVTGQEAPAVAPTVVSGHTDSERNSEVEISTTQLQEVAVPASIEELDTVPTNELSTTSPTSELTPREVPVEHPATVVEETTVDEVTAQLDSAESDVAQDATEPTHSTQAEQAATEIADVPNEVTPAQEETTTSSTDFTNPSLDFELDLPLEVTRMVQQASASPRESVDTSVASDKSVVSVPAQPHAMPVATPLRPVTIPVATTRLTPSNTADKTDESV